MLYALAFIHPVGCVGGKYAVSECPLVTYWNYACFGWVDTPIKRPWSNAATQNHFFLENWKQNKSSNSGRFILYTVNLKHDIAPLNRQVIAVLKNIGLRSDCQLN